MFVFRTVLFTTHSKHRQLLPVTTASWGNSYTWKCVVGEKSVQASTLKPRCQKTRFKAGTGAIREIKKFQSTTNLLVPGASFCRVVREAMQTLGKGDHKFSTTAMIKLQEATEMATVNLSDVANLRCMHAKRVTLTWTDTRLTSRAFGLGHPLND